MPGPITTTPVRPVPTGGPASAPATVDAAAIDVASAEFRTLPAAWQRAVKDAKSALATDFKGLTPPPRVWVTAAPSNGTAPVTVVVPASARAPFTVQTHYHGDFARSLASNPATSAIAKNLRSGGDTVFVLPEAGRPGKPTDWTNVRSFGATTAEALSGAGLSGDVGSRVVSVHSAGGRALKRALENGETLSAHHLVLQDALFEGESSRGVATFLKQRLPAVSGDVGRITIVPSTGPGAAGLMKDLDEPSFTRTQVLAKALQAAGRTVDVVTVTTHDDAARQLRPASPTPRDGFVR